jgi:hypothetical protein
MPHRNTYQTLIYRFENISDKALDDYIKTNEQRGGIFGELNKPDITDIKSPTKIMARYSTISVSEISHVIRDVYWEQVGDIKEVRGILRFSGNHGKQAEELYLKGLTEFIPRTYLDINKETVLVTFDLVAKESHA